MKIEFVFVYLLFNQKFCKRLQILKQNAYRYQESNYQVTQQQCMRKMSIGSLPCLFNNFTSWHYDIEPMVP